MKKFKVTIEETVSQEFIIDAESMEEAMDKTEALYKNADLVLENPNLCSAQIQCEDMDSHESTEWNEIY